jgi:hypothetical protein
MGRDVLDLDSAGSGRKVIGRADAALGVAEIGVAIREIDGEAWRYFVGKAGIKRSGEIGLGVVLGESDAQNRDVDVFQADDVDGGEADAAADIGRDAMPGAEIDIGIGKSNPAFDVRRIFVRGRTELLIGILGEEHGASAIFAGDVEAEIVAGVVAEAEAPERRALDVLVVDDEGVVEQEFLGV